MTDRRFYAIFVFRGTVLPQSIPMYIFYACVARLRCLVCPTTSQLYMNTNYYSCIQTLLMMLFIVPIAERASLVHDGNGGSPKKGPRITRSFITIGTGPYP
ncbi:hypothetical protein B0H10DRAFT_2067085, partial [Mycena sp. CBHHK59/15]